MEVEFTKKARKQFNRHPKKLQEKIDKLLNKIVSGKEGKPLKRELTGCWSFRIIKQHRLVYQKQDKKIEVISCFGHYND